MVGVHQRWMGWVGLLALGLCFAPTLLMAKKPKVSQEFLQRYMSSSDSKYWQRVEQLRQQSFTVRSRHIRFKDGLIFVLHTMEKPKRADINLFSARSQHGLIKGYVESSGKKTDSLALTVNDKDYQIIDLNGDADGRLVEVALQAPGSSSDLFMFTDFATSVGIASFAASIDDRTVDRALIQELLGPGIGSDPKYDDLAAWKPKAPVVTAKSASPSSCKESKE